MKFHDFAPPTKILGFTWKNLFSNAHVHNSFDQSWAIGEPYCFDQVRLKIKVGQVPQFC